MRCGCPIHQKRTSRGLKRSLFVRFWRIGHYGSEERVPDDAQPAAAPSTSASVATQSAARKPETANSLFAPLALLTKWLHTWRLTVVLPPASYFVTCLARMRSVLWLACTSWVSRNCPCLPATRLRPPASSQTKSVSTTQSELFPEDKVAAVKSATEAKHQKLSLWNRIKQRATGESKNRQITMMSR